ncbi:hypothetical protein [Phytoactinopolyspora mesophila]|uniref:hypothetical protein n=1 Tax=Phytoactinopolyspora mesophila TaxID=2650750 RepID=UPI001C9E3AB9|nr:hypothetical protein [Phytoactinopolyspora mesophila]
MGPDGRPDAAPATPLLLADQPVVALPYAYDQLARTIAKAPAVGLTLSDPRLTGANWKPLAVIARPRLIEDRDGAIFAEHLVTQELRKYPPARALIDSPMLRREHWWYVPRLLILIEPDSATAVTAVAARREPSDLLLSVTDGIDITIDTVRPEDTGTEQLRLTSLTGRALPDGAAALLGHDFSVPDFERWTSWLTRGQLSDGFLRVEERPERTTLEPTLTLWQRFRRQRQLERACRRGLNA